MTAEAQLSMQVLLRGVPHSATAREQFNQTCVDLGVDPNEMLRHLHGAS
jgi:hypothetical protein